MSFYLFIPYTRSYGVVVKTRSRIPAYNSFLARRVEGPGLSYTLFQQISTDEALVSLQVRLRSHFRSDRSIDHIGKRRTRDLGEQDPQRDQKTCGSV